jgi:hypothetical protein
LEAQIAGAFAQNLAICVPSQQLSSFEKNIDGTWANISMIAAFMTPLFAKASARQANAKRVYP